jgi:hypothetical protein
LEQQLIAAISKNLLDPRLEQQRIRDFSAQLEARIELEEKLASESVSNAPKLTADVPTLKTKRGVSLMPSDNTDIRLSYRRSFPKSSLA